MSSTRWRSWPRILVGTASRSRPRSAAGISLTLPRPWPRTMPSSAKWPRSALMCMVFCLTSSCRIRCSWHMLCCSIVLTGNEAHGRAGHRLADRLRVGGVVLVALDVRLHVLGRDQPDLVPQLDQLAGPMVGAAAGLHADQARRQVGEERQQLASGQLLAQHRPALRVGTVHLEPGLCQVEPDCRNLRHGRLPLVVVLTPGTVMP